MCSKVSKLITAYPGHTSERSGNEEGGHGPGSHGLPDQTLQIEELIEKINKVIEKEGRTTFTISLLEAMPSHPAQE